MKNSKQIKNPNQNDGYFDDCPICQAMKKSGMKMERYPDGAGNDGIWEEGFYAAKIDPKEMEKMKKLFRKHGGVVFEDKE